MDPVASAFMVVFCFMIALGLIIIFAMVFKLHVRHLELLREMRALRREGVDESQDGQLAGEAFVGKEVER
ncbi:MAG: hypothetical protein AB1486_18665 [Planctomycetota bacterium]